MTDTLRPPPKTYRDLVQAKKAGRRRRHETERESRDRMIASWIAKGREKSKDPPRLGDKEYIPAKVRNPKYRKRLRQFQVLRMHLWDPIWRMNLNGPSRWERMFPKYGPGQTPVWSYVTWTLERQEKEKRKLDKAIEDLKRKQSGPYRPRTWKRGYIRGPAERPMTRPPSTRPQTRPMTRPHGSANTYRKPAATPIGFDRASERPHVNGRTNRDQIRDELRQAEAELEGATEKEAPDLKQKAEDLRAELKRAQPVPKKTAAERMGLVKGADGHWYRPGTEPKTLEDDGRAGWRHWPPSGTHRENKNKRTIHRAPVQASPVRRKEKAQPLSGRQVGRVKHASKPTQPEPRFVREGNDLVSRPLGPEVPVTAPDSTLERVKQGQKERRKARDRRPTEGTAWPKPATSPIAKTHVPARGPKPAQGPRPGPKPAAPAKKAPPPPKAHLDAHKARLEYLLGETEDPRRRAEIKADLGRTENDIRHRDAEAIKKAVESAKRPQPKPEPAPPARAAPKKAPTKVAPAAANREKKVPPPGNRKPAPAPLTVKRSHAPAKVGRQKRAALERKTRPEPVRQGLKDRPGRGRSL